ncbi:uncharacterized protein SCHCODRAFT_02643646 [Schizophyllum commune H4-8]|nr:uncharacterized protein SCHCODRAFT_02643646 [Schizophyllum commune H4-8]KAI5885505.1 hypothetical protein SCHCODRAFT_02643646 [Schizophyllum commune H4-8]
MALTYPPHSHLVSYYPGHPAAHLASPYLGHPASHLASPYLGHPARWPHHRASDAGAVSHVQSPNRVRLQSTTSHALCIVAYRLSMHVVAHSGTPVPARDEERVALTCRRGRQLPVRGNRRDPVATRQQPRACTRAVPVCARFARARTPSPS